MREEYEIIFITEEGRAIKNNKTGKIYHSEFEIIDEKNKEIDRLNNIINELEKYMIKEQARIVIENTDEDEFVYTELLQKLKELKENNK